MRALWRRLLWNAPLIDGLLDGDEPEIIAFGGNEMSKVTKVSVGNDEKFSVASAEDLHMRRCLNDGYKGSGATWGIPAEAKQRS